MSWKLSALVFVALVAGVGFARIAEDSSTGTATWDAARAAGFSSYLLLWLSVVSGISVHMRYRIAAGPLSLVLESHRAVSVLALAFLGVHLAALLLDPVVAFSLLDALVPLTSSYRPVQVGLGTVAGWLLVVVLVSTAFAGSMRWSLWRNLHLLAFPAWVLALAHGLTAGTDSGAPVALLIYAASASLVAALAVARLLGRGWIAAEA